MSLQVRIALAKHDASRIFENSVSAFCRRLPKRIRYMTFIGVLAEATTDPELRDQEVPGMHLDDLLRVTHRRLAA